jgi:hypothetical protein
MVAERRILLQLDNEPHQDAEGDLDAADFDYSAWDGMSSITVASANSELQRRHSTWSHHTGLYDGTGYGDDSPMTSEPASPTDAETGDVCRLYEPRSVKEQPVSSEDNHKRTGEFATRSECSGRDADLTPKSVSGT